MNSTLPFVSVIIPTFNRKNELRNCLKFLQEQTFKNFEIIVSDDGSTDNSFEVIEEFRESLELHYITGVNFGGPARARNSGLKIAKGIYIAFLDSDDWWYPNKLEVCLTYLKDYDLVHHDLDIYTKAGKSKKVAKGRELRGNIPKDLIINGNGILNSSVILKKNIIDLVGEISEDVNLISVEDYDYWIRITQKTSKIKYLDISFGGYYVADNISYSLKQIKREKYLLDKYFQSLSIEEQKTAISIHHFNSARIYHIMSKYSEASSCYIQALRKKNLYRQLKSFIGLLMCQCKIK